MSEKPELWVDPHWTEKMTALSEKKARAELRDRFAMAALTGLLANPAEARISPAEWTYDAYRFADAMLKARGDE